MDLNLALATDDGCALAIGSYPRFLYDGRGGGGVGRAAGPLAEGWCGVVFAPASLTIPSLSTRTTRFLGLPLPPGLQIAIAPEELQGRWHPERGDLELKFVARFRPLLAARQVAPDLMVSTRLTTGAVRSRRHQTEGSRLDGQGRGTLVGTAMVAPTGEGWVDRFLGLPDEALAVLRCQFRSAQFRGTIEAN
jgi:hypothetical protein